MKTKRLRIYHLDRLVQKSGYDVMREMVIIAASPKAARQLGSVRADGLPCAGREEFWLHAENARCTCVGTAAVGQQPRVLCVEFLAG